MRIIFAISTVIAISLFLSPSLWAKTFYLKNGEEIECQSYRQEGDRIYVLINRDTEVDFGLEEVDLDKTDKGKRNIREGRKVKRAAKTNDIANTNDESKTLQATETTDPPPADTTWWGAGETPANYMPGTSQLKNELVFVYRKYNRAAQAGDFDEVVKYMPTYQAQRTMEELAKVKDKKERLLRKKTLQEMAVKDFSALKCALSPDGTIAALVVEGKRLHGDKYRDAKGTIKFVKQSGEWKVTFQMW